VSEFAFVDGATTPRKRAVQDRSQHTVMAILEATIRVLGEVGAALTTTRVAEVAGVSVGTLYQYFPNREALINGVLADHLEHAIAAVERTVEAVRGLPLGEAAPRVVRAFLAAKSERAEVSRVLHTVFELLDDRPIVKAAARRAELAVASLLAGADAQARAAVLCAALEGVVRAAIMDDPMRLSDPAWIENVVALTAGAVAARPG
jgi:AcrR family transcriptional regulator